jgi:cytochrome c biogenesis protein CcmG/thiol:disulfide interchange protein DsbE
MVKEYSGDGNHFDMNISEAEAGKDYVLVEFFAFWCYYCNQSKPVIKDLSEKYQDRLTVKAVTVEPMSDPSILEKMEKWESEAPLINVSSDTDPNYPSLMAYGVEGFPTFFLLDSNGAVVHKHVGLLTPQNSIMFQAILNNN